MSLLPRAVSAVFTLAFAVAVGVGAWWLLTSAPGGSSVEKKAPAATVTKVVKEDELNTVTLSEQAAQSLGVKHGVVAKKAVRRVRVYGGEVTIPTGQAIVVSAPLGGVLRAPDAGVPKVGQRVKKGQPVFLLSPLLTPEARTTLASAQVDADGQVKGAEAQRDGTKIAVDRSKRLLKEGVGFQRNLDEAQVAYDIALKGLEAAQARLTLLTKVVGELDKGTGAPIAIDSPEDGLLRNLSALPGQNVPAGGGLFEVVDLDRVWVRVPLPAGDLDEIARTEEASVGNLNAAPGAKSHPAKPVAAPPSANALAATVDVFYETPNADGRLTPGQRVGVTLPLADAKESVTLPWSAVIFDINGGTWVYEQKGPRTYARRRVIVRHVSGADAVLEGGPAVGTVVLAEGGQELFGAETGFSK